MQLRHLGLTALSLLLLLLVAIVSCTAEEKESPFKLRRPKLRLKSSNDNNKTESASPAPAAQDRSLDADEDASKDLRTRKRVRRPVVVTPGTPTEDRSDSNDEANLSSRFTPSRGGFGQPKQTEDDEEETPSSGPPPEAFSSRASLSTSSSSSKNSLAPKLTSPNQDGYKVVCYYTNWSQYRPKVGKFLPENIDPFLCTHVIFAFGWIKNGKLTSFEPSDITSEAGKTGLYQRVVGLKAANPKLKVLLAIGGWSFGTAKFTKMAETRFSRQTFIFSAIPFLRQHNFDGLDMDWEYPKAADKDNFSALLKELREAFEFEAEETKNARLLLTAAVPVGPDNVRGGYDVPEVGKWLDFVNLMAYDFHGKWEQQAGHNAPLFAPSSDSEWRKQLSVSFAAKMWVKLGTPKEKLVIGMPTYGRSFTLTNPGQFVVNSATKDGGKAGEYTREAGFLSYYEVCQMLLDGSSYIWDDEMKVPYLVKGDQWVGFDDERSIRNKMDWIKSEGFAGAMVWSIDMDDFNGTVCGSGVKYPLIGAMREELLGTPRDTVAKGIEASDIDWESVAKAPPQTQATTLPSAQRIDIKDLLQQVGQKSSSKLPALLTPAVDTSVRPPRIFCYFTNWSYKRPGMGKFTPEDIDATLCTHVVFAFATIKDHKLTASEDKDVGDAFTDGNYDRMMKLKEANPELKVLLAVAGGPSGQSPSRSSRGTSSA